MNWIKEGKGKDKGSSAVFVTGAPNSGLLTEGNLNTKVLWSPRVGAGLFEYSSP